MIWGCMKMCHQFSERKSNPRIEGLDLSNFDSTLASVAPVMDRINYRYVFDIYYLLITLYFSDQSLD